MRKLEELGIGRPSTYAPTIQTIQNREYVDKREVIAKEREIVQLTLTSSLKKKHLQKSMVLIRTNFYQLI